MTTNAIDPLLDDLTRLQRLVQWCQERGLSPRDVIECRVDVPLPPEAWPGPAVLRAALSAYRART